MKPFLLPLIAWFLGVLAILFWAAGEWDRAQSVHTQAAREYVNGTAATFEVLVKHVTPRNRDEEVHFRELFNDLVEQSDALRYVRLENGPRVIAETRPPMRVPIGPEPAGELWRDDMIIAWRPVQVPSRLVPAGPPLGPGGPGSGPDSQRPPPGQGPPPGAHPPAGGRPGDGEGRPRYPPRGTEQADDESAVDPLTGLPRRPMVETPPMRVTLVLGFEPTIARATLDRERDALVGKFAAAQAVSLALMVAWGLRIRSGRLRRTLQLERAERAHLEELRLAAAGLAHETKNPLGIISGLAQRIARQARDADSVQEMADEIVDEADRASVRLGEFIRYARHPEPRVQIVDARKLVDHVRVALTPDFESAGVVLETTIEPLRIDADPEMLMQLLTNLLLNGVQASERGKRVSVTLARTGQAARLTIADHGRGIPKDKQEEVLKPYVTARPGGHGLGLAIVKRIADRHGWTLALDSTVGVGTTITITGIKLASSEATSSNAISDMETTA